MGELLRREAAAKPLDFSGERLTAAISGQIEIEHYHRYLLARDYCRGLEVLDCASGEGYGSALLAQVAQSVVGLDIDQESVKAARQEFPYPNLSFQQGDARAIPLPDSSVDVVVSFETLEHIDEQDTFLEELRRVLRPNGLLIISTPDRDIYSPIGAEPNPHHRRELTRTEFEVLLQRHFAHAKLSGQRAMIGSVIIGPEEGGIARSFERRGVSHIEASDYLLRAMYLVALASRAPLPALRSSVYVYRSDIDTDTQVRFEAEIGRRAAEQRMLEAAQSSRTEQASVDAKVNELEARFLSAEQRAGESQARESHASEVVAALNNQTAQLRAQAGRAEHRLALSEVDLADASARIAETNSKLAEASSQLAEAIGQTAVLRQNESSMGERLSNALTRAERAEHLCAELKRQFEAVTFAYAAAQQLGADLSRQLERIELSSVWRGSYPLRRLGSRYPTMSRGIRYGAKLIWWSVTLQLVRRYRVLRDLKLSQSETNLVDATDETIFDPDDTSDDPDLLLSPPTTDDVLLLHPNLALGAVIPGAEVGKSVDDLVTESGAVSSTEGISIPHSDYPTVSLLIPTYGLLNVTLRCLRSISSSPPVTAVEVIVVDDAYPGPDDMSILRDIPGIVFVRNETNLGFLKSSNKAASIARGRYLHLLNNDTELCLGSVDALVQLLDGRPDVGLAGSKLLFPDGRLQEAGGIVWNDASGWNFGRGENPDRPEYNYVREVDYCSGASIMVSRKLFHTLCGFDEAFAPAYYEDTDLAFRVRASGYKVVYEPRSVVIHHEGASHGTDLTCGIKAYQVVNRDHMVAVWKDTLAIENYDPWQHVLRARDRGKTRKIILVLEHYVLEPDRDAGSRSTMGIIDSLLASGWVVKFWPINRQHSPVYTAAMEHHGIEVIDKRWPGDLEMWMRQYGRELDHVLIVRPTVAPIVLQYVMPHVNAPLSFYGVDLHFARVGRQAKLDNDPERMQEAADLERLERRVWRNFDLIIYPSEAEAAFVRGMAPNTLACGIVPFSFDVQPPRMSVITGRNILFVAGFAHPPNVDAADFLISKIIPLVRALVGDVTVTLAGSNPTERVRSLASEHVRVTGYLTDDELAMLYKSHRVSVVPLRFGAGVKGKVIESLSYGLPFVTTSTGAQGIDGLAQIVPIHDDAGKIAEALAVLLTNNEVWLRQSQAQTAFASDRFSRETMRRSVVAAFDLLERTYSLAPAEYSRY